MPKVKYVLTALDCAGPIEKALGRRDSSAGVYDDADLKRRMDAAKRAGVEVKVKKL